MTTTKNFENASDIQKQLQNLKVSLTARSPATTPAEELSSGERTALILRDLPKDVNRAEILALFPDKPSPQNSADEATVCKTDVLSVFNEFGQNWTLRFASEKNCVAAAMALRAKTLRGEVLHSRVAGRTLGARKESAAEPQNSPFPSYLNRYGNQSPMFYSSSFSPILSPATEESFLNKIEVPPGVFGEQRGTASPVSPSSNSIPVSPMTRILGNSPSTLEIAMGPDFNVQSPPSEQIESQYRKILKMKQSSLDSVSADCFPPNMVKSLSKRKVRRFLGALSKQRFEAPRGFFDEDGTPRYFKRGEMDPVVCYGGELPVINPNAVVE
ncbi:hypothetical protein MHBO_001208 [Bonamia ostreae]|uniref:RRM domain-containing protein n=1 Tax=Bonamia ostreae TaxID=126728 RepID=A0ABV2AIC0_9EUKA